MLLEHYYLFFFFATAIILFVADEIRRQAGTEVPNPVIKYVEEDN